MPQDILINKFILAQLTKSSMFPYTFFFIPDALVATHPPKVLNSIESGSCPVQ